MSRVRLLAVISSLGGGGAERQMVLLLKHLDRARFDPTLCFFSDEGEFRSAVPGDIPVVAFRKRSRWDGGRVVSQLARRVRQNRPGVILSRLAYTNTVAALANCASLTKTPLVVVEDSVQSDELPLHPHPVLRRGLLRWAYRTSKLVVAPS